MSDYGHDFSFYLLSQLSEKTSVSSEVTRYHHLYLPQHTHSGSQSSAECPFPHPHISGGPNGSSHMLINKCILPVQAVWEAPHLWIPLYPHYWGQWSPLLGTSSRNSISTFEGHGRPVSLGVPEVFKLQGTSAKRWEMSFLWLISCRRTQ